MKMMGAMPRRRKRRDRTIDDAPPLKSRRVMRAAKAIPPASQSGAKVLALRTPRPCMKFSRISTGSRCVWPCGGWLSVLHAISVFSGLDSAFFTCASKSSGERAHSACLTPQARATSTMSVWPAVAVGCEPVI
jgi:hypothetical protein